MLDKIIDLIKFLAGCTIFVILVLKAPELLLFGTLILIVLIFLCQL